jgi:hypothetical protein
MLWQQNHVLLETITTLVVHEYQDKQNNRQTVSFSETSVILDIHGWRFVNDLTAFSICKAACQLFVQGRLRNVDPPLLFSEEHGFLGFRVLHEDGITFLAFNRNEGGESQDVAHLDEVAVIAFGLALGKALNALRDQPVLKLPIKGQ